MHLCDTNIDLALAARRTTHLQCATLAAYALAAHPKPAVLAARSLAAVAAVRIDASGLAFAAAAALTLAAFDLAGGLAVRPEQFGGPVRAAVDAFTRAGNEGRDPGAAERRRLLAVGAIAAFAAGWFVFGIPGALIAAALAPTVASRLLRARRERYRRAVED